MGQEWINPARSISVLGSWLSLHCRHTYITIKVLKVTKQFSGKYKAGWSLLFRDYLRPRLVSFFTPHTYNYKSFKSDKTYSKFRSKKYKAGWSLLFRHSLSARPVSLSLYRYITIIVLKVTSLFVTWLARHKKNPLQSRRLFNSCPSRNHDFFLPLERPGILSLER